jgi:DNA-binding beta-propeller fold protein YncE
VTISTNYNTVNVLRTIEDVLGINHLNFRDADAAPMADVFTQKPDYTPYSAIIPGDLCAAPVDPNLVPACQNTTAKITPAVPQLHDAAWWAAKTKGFDFSEPTESMLTHSTASCGRAAWATTLPTRQYAAARTCD